MRWLGWCMQCSRRWSSDPGWEAMCYMKVQMNRTGTAG